MAKINYFIQSKRNPAGIYIRFRDGRKADAKTKTKFSINPDDWSVSKGQPKNLKNADFKNLNEELKRLSTDLLNHYNKSNSDTIINTEWLKNYLQPRVNLDAAPTKLVDYFDHYAKHVKNDVKASTSTKIHVNKHLIERFQNATKREYFIKDVNADFKLEFENYCMEQKYAQNTIARAFKFIKTICYHAQDKHEIEIHHQLKKLSIQIETVEKIYLTIQDLKKIEKAELKFDYLNNARDWLIISTETGQRISDFMRFNKGMTYYTNKIPLIEFIQVKTGKSMVIPLSEKVMEILKKNSGDFPRKISDQRYNDYIKEVCRIAGINQLTKGAKSKTENKITRKENGMFEKWQLVTSHIGRRTFATNNYGRIATPLLMGATGHSTEKMFMIYIGKTPEDRALDLAKELKKLKRK